MQPHLDPLGQAGRDCFGGYRCCGWKTGGLGFRGLGVPKGFRVEGLGFRGGFKS